jgi:phosphoglycolate phosphatase
MAELRFGDHPFCADLVIFDKDGTLIDFTELSAYYTVNAVEALVEATKALAKNEVQLRADLYAMLGYDTTTRRFDTQSPVLTAPWSTIYTLAAGVLYRHGWGWLSAELQVERSFIPVMTQPLTRQMIRPTAPLPVLFHSLQEVGVQIAVITSDDRTPTLAALDLLDISEYVTFVAGADDPYPYKPAPEAIWAACQAAGVDLAHTVMVGDSTTDMLMAERAGVGLRVAVLTGLMDATILAPHAHVVLDSVGDIRVAR